MNCLCGSEPAGRNILDIRAFLSCLCGSLEMMPGRVRPLFNVHCLYGSEHILSIFEIIFIFLSCRIGSLERLRYPA